MADVNWPAVLGPIIADLGVAEVSELQSAIGKHSPRAVRMHTSITPNDLPFESEAIPWLERGRWLVDSGCRPGAFLSYAAGDYYIQDAGSMFALALCEVQPGDWICDTCAAPGGKSSGLLELLRGTGLLVSNEVIRSRLEILEMTLARAGYPNYLVTQREVNDLAIKYSDAFDSVLVDAPCTGQSLVARGKQSSAAYSSRQIEHSAARQQRILRSAAELVKPGGRLVYSTCTFSFAENEAMIDWFRSQHPLWTAVRVSSLSPWESANHEGCYRLWPHRDRCAGAFAAALIRPVHAESLAVAQLSDDKFGGRKPKPAGTRVAFTRAKIAKVDLRWLSTENDPIYLWSRGSKLHYFPSFVPTDWIESGHAGVPVAESRGGEWQPCYASSVVALPELAPAELIELDDDQACAYFAGDAIRFPVADDSTPDNDAHLSAAVSSGSATPWTVLSWNKRRVAWSKFTTGILKNHLPKSLRKPHLTMPTRDEATFRSSLALPKLPSP